MYKVLLKRENNKVNERERDIYIEHGKRNNRLCAWVRRVKYAMYSGDIAVLNRCKFRFPARLMGCRCLLL